MEQMLYFCVKLPVRSDSLWLMFAFSSSSMPFMRACGERSGPIAHVRSFPSFPPRKGGEARSTGKGNREEIKDYMDHSFEEAAS